MDLIYHARSDYINWWVNHVKLFPNLEPIARMARQYHSVSAVSVTVERLFSAVGFAFADRRKRTCAEPLIDKLAFVKLIFCPQ